MSKVESHELIKAVKDLAIELGRTPRLREFQNRFKGADHHLRKHFGMWSVLLKAAGVEEVRFKEEKITNAIFEKDIEEQISAHVPIDIQSRPVIPYKKTLVIGDCHFPFVHKPTLEKIIEFCEKFKPEIIVQVGDLYDNFSHSKFPRSMNIYTPKDEIELARSMASDMWERLRKASPNAEMHQLFGNHCIRPMKRILETYPEAELFLDFEKWFKFEGVTLQTDHREELIIGDIAFIHGYRGGIGEHRDHMMMNVVCGHTHLGGVSFRSIQGRTLWELNAGYCGDPESKALSYTPQKSVKWTLGWAVIDELGPRFIPA